MVNKYDGNIDTYVSQLVSEAIGHEDYIKSSVGYKQTFCAKNRPISLSRQKLLNQLRGWDDMKKLKEAPYNGKKDFFDSEYLLQVLRYSYKEND